SVHTTVFAGISTGGLWKSTDAGATWAPSTGVATGVSLIRVDPKSSSIVYAGGSFLYRSTDGGATFARTTTNPQGSNAIAFDAQSDAVTTGGVSFGGDAAVVHLDAAGSIAFSTFLSGTGDEKARGLALHPSGTVHV